jgi:putative radical SAM enzyme (TIGR03279 family)
LFEERRGESMNRFRSVIRSVGPRSDGAAAGLRAGDIVVAVNGETVEDELEFQYLTAQKDSSISVVRARRVVALRMRRAAGTETGVRFFPAPIARCRNHCIFCFIDQMPKGLRKELYVKDEDWRHSFLYGNYITMTTMTRREMQKIVRFGISPLYVSVHAADPAVRNFMLGRSGAPDILAQLRFFAHRGVSFHTQIVVCPGINDRKVLKKTVTGLLSLGPSLRSIAVVPVGLTRYHANGLRPVSDVDAVSICREIGELSDRDVARNGTRRVLLADELFLRAGARLPPSSYYGDYPQIENGVGLLRKLLSEWSRFLRREKAQRQEGLRQGRRAYRPFRFMVCTSVSAYPYLSRMLRTLAKRHTGLQVTCRPVINGLFGPMVTVAGLLAGSDILREVRAAAQKPRRIIVPAVMFNSQGRTLDGYTVAALQRECGRRITAVSSIGQLIGILGIDNRRGGQRKTVKA